MDSFFIGAPEAIRTPDARFRKPTLYPLSYRGIFCLYRRVKADADTHLLYHALSFFQLLYFIVDYSRIL